MLKMKVQTQAELVEKQGGRSTGIVKNLFIFVSPKKNQKIFKKMSQLVDIYFLNAYNSASNLKERVLKKSKRG